MKFGHKDRSEQSKRRKAAPGSLVAHPVFAPMLGLWGALLGGLAVMVVPPAVIANALRGTFAATLGGLMQPVGAGLAAVMLGGTLFVIAAAMNRRARRRANAPSVAAMAVRQVRPIDPARDLGSRSLDDPLDSMPFAKPAWQEADDAEPEAEAGPAPADETAPRALDLSEFADLPGRNAVWVEEASAMEAIPEAEAEAGQEPEPVTSAPVAQLREPAPLPEPGTAALARLRAVPPSELSLAEMVERFAGALHEHRASPPTRALSAADLAAREAALAEALKALAALSGDEVSGHVREPLRAALAQLQTPRRAGGGAA
jgi:predicted lipid-binding transport protein (Tim44 family)